MKYSYRIRSTVLEEETKQYFALLQFICRTAGRAIILSSFEFEILFA